VPHHVDEVDAVAHVGDVLLVQEGLVARGEDVGRGAVLPAEGLGDFEHVAAVHVGVFAGGGGGAAEGREDGWGEGGGDGFGPWGWGLGWEGRDEGREGGEGGKGVRVGGWGIYISRSHG